MTRPDTAAASPAPWEGDQLASTSRSEGGSSVGILRIALDLRRTQPLGGQE